VKGVGQQRQHRWRVGGDKKREGWLACLRGGGERTQRGKASARDSVK